MAIMIQLARLTDRIALMYHNRDTEPALISALESAQGIFEELNELEVDMPARLRNFDFRSEGEDRIDLDTEEGEVSHVIGCLKGLQHQLTLSNIFTDRSSSL